LKKIALSQRVVIDPRTKERRDILDQQWTELAEVAGFIPIPIPNRLRDPKVYLQSMNIDAVILTGGNNIGCREGQIIEGLSMEDNDVAYERDFTESEVLNFCIEHELPVLGVCRGLQFIHSFFGGELIPVEREVHVAKRHELQFCETLFQSIYGPNEVVNSYHNYGVSAKALPSELIANALYIDEVEALKHHTKEIYGIMWHPEREKIFSNKDLLLINKIFKL
jgi:N5-(cytidine 5'-diphosphoramidyl)-L-glutamine hydrolase